MCCQIFHNFSFKYEHNFSSVTFIFVSGELQPFVPCGPQFRGAAAFRGARRRQQPGARRPTWGGGEGSGVWMHLRLPPPLDLSAPPDTLALTAHTWLSALYYSARLLCDKDHTVGGLNHRHLLFHSPGDWPGDWKSKIKVWAGLVPCLACGWLSSLWVHIRSSLCLSLCPDLLFSQGPLLHGIGPTSSQGPPKCSLEYQITVF